MCGWSTNDSDGTAELTPATFTTLLVTTGYKLLDAAAVAVMTACSRE